MQTQVVEKVLSSTDTGATGSHQAGMLVPKERTILGFFPALDPGLKNPRTVLQVNDEAGQEWAFQFIYYNNRYFGGTRDEFRLTGMTRYIREFNLRAGDTVILRRLSPRQVRISYRKAGFTGGKVLKLSGNWKVIEADV